MGFRGANVHDLRGNSIRVYKCYSALNLKDTVTFCKKLNSDREPDVEMILQYFVNSILYFGF